MIARIDTNPRRRIAVLLAAAALAGLALAGESRALGTPDGRPPSRETVCDGLKGALFGLCNAYCEAMDCDSPNPHASPEACNHVFNNYVKHSGGEAPPCDFGGGGG